MSRTEITITDSWVEIATKSANIEIVKIPKDGQGSLFFNDVASDVAQKQVACSSIDFVKMKNTITQNAEVSTFCRASVAGKFVVVVDDN